MLKLQMSSTRTATTTDWDEIDFEFLGNVTGQPWILQTNIFTGGKGDREQRIFLWFDPTARFHTYSILWTTQQIVYVPSCQPKHGVNMSINIKSNDHFGHVRKRILTLTMHIKLCRCFVCRWYVDNVPIRIYRNTPTTSATYPKWKPMAVYGSVWNGDSWATRGGLDKINFAYAPFVVSYNKFYIDACKFGQASTPPACYTNPSPYWWANYALTSTEKKLYTLYTKTYTIYNYCNDYPNRFPVQPPECKDAPW